MRKTSIYGIDRFAEAFEPTALRKPTFHRYASLIETTSPQHLYSDAIKIYWRVKNRQTDKPASVRPAKTASDTIKENAHRHMETALLTDDKMHVAAELLLAAHLWIIAALEEKKNPHGQASNFECASHALKIILDYLKKTEKPEETMKAVIREALQTEDGQLILEVLKENVTVSRLEQRWKRTQEEARGIMARASRLIGRNMQMEKTKSLLETANEKLAAPE